MLILIQISSRDVIRVLRRDVECGSTMERVTSMGIIQAQEI